MSLDPHKTKYFQLYWDMVDLAAAQSVALRHQVGAVVVTPKGMISIGWNGMPAGLSNECENFPLTANQKTKQEVIHAEHNAVSKLISTGIPIEGSLLFISRSPCIECAKLLHNIGLRGIFFKEEHDETDGIALLRRTGTPCLIFNDPCTFQI